MAQDDLSLGARLALRERELALILDLDRIQEHYETSASSADASYQALEAATRKVCEAVAADAGLLVGLDHAARGENAQISTMATFDPGCLIPTLDPDSLGRVTRMAWNLETASALEPGDALKNKSVRHVLCTPLGAGARQAGGLVLFSRHHRFAENDVLLLSTVASKVGSMVRQVHMWGQLDSRYRELQERNRQLDIIYQLDRLRDQAGDMGRFVSQTADMLVSSLGVDLCLLGLVEEDQGEIVVKAVHDRANVLQRLGQPALRELLQRAVAAETVCTLTSNGSPPAQELDVCAAPLVVDGNRLGALVLANCRPSGGEGRLFSSADLDLVRAVVSQADSAVAHMRVCEAAQERARQLETIYRIDRIRDDAQSAQEILSSVVSLVTDALGADLCLMNLINEETGRSELKALEDRLPLGDGGMAFGSIDKDALEQAARWAASQQGVGALQIGSPLGKWGLKYLLGAPLVVGGEKLGSLLLASGRKPFSRFGRDLLRAVISQTDSAIVHARAQHHLRQRQRELETLYRVDHIRDQSYEFGEMLSAVLGELCSAIDAEMGFIMLFDPEGRQLELRASTANDILASSGHYDVINRAAHEALRTGTLYTAERLTDWLDAIMCVPLILRNKIIGVFGAANHRGPGGFTSEEKRLLMAITSQVDTAIFESLDKQRIRETFRRYVGPAVMEQMLATPEKDFLKVERARLTSLFSDIRGFTSIGERLDSNVLVEMLNAHLAAMTDVVLTNQGTLDKYVGDEVVAIFGAPLSMKDHTLRAITTALQMQEVQKGLMAQWSQRGYYLPPIGIGVNTGEVIVGNIGCEQQMDYTVIGDAVNVASRLCDAALGGQILITEDTYALVADKVLADKLPRIRVQGKEEPLQVYQVNGLVEPS